MHSGFSCTDLQNIDGIILFIWDVIVESIKTLHVNDIINPDLLRNLWVKYSHHYRFTCFLLLQSPFQRSIKTIRDVNLNTNYSILLKSRRSIDGIYQLSKQLFPGNSKFFMEVFKDATSMNQYGYLLCDTHNTTNEKLMLRTNIFFSERPIIL